jgi:tRNA-splicing ligase RtcB
MKSVITTEKVPIKLWLDDIEDEALQQAKNLSNLPFTNKWVSLMPDSHLGVGVPIGSVFVTKDVIVPNAIGVDIGCGMCAVKTNLTSIDISKLKEIMGEIRKRIPVGFNHRKENKATLLLAEEIISEYETIYAFSTSSLEKDIASQVGTLGGGNHFLELQRGNDGFVWIMLHSGSRNIGKRVADYHNKIATEVNDKWYSNAPKEYKLPFLPLSSEEGTQYFNDMKFCCEFAFQNRKFMMDEIKDIFVSLIDDVHFDETINIHHNYASWENHYGENVIVHRKGATSAREGQLGIIPGSQGTKSYIVRGKGNPESFDSCSHGAGRKMGRKMAQRTLDLETEQKFLNDQGIIHSIRNVSDLDEASGSYKDIGVVMNNQKDLVDVVVELSPLAVIKG